MENRNWKKDNRKTPPFIPQKQRDAAEVHETSPQGSPTGSAQVGHPKTFSELRGDRPPNRSGFK